MDIDRNEIIQLTEEYGGVWGINHTRRLINLVEIIADGQAYDQDVIWIAAHLHDWGIYSTWAQKDVDHALRSVYLADSFLSARKFPRDKIEHILEVIRYHHNCDRKKRIETVLFSDADALDFLGVVGVLRDFSKNPKNLRKAYEQVRQRREKVPQMILLDKSKEIASVRVHQMDVLLDQFVEESKYFF